VGERAEAALWLEDWERLARNAFLDGYASATDQSPVRLVPPSRDDILRACAPFEIDKACYELAYELDNRPDWVEIPLAGLSRLLARG
jgi:predicted trehalose synthase